MSEPTAQDLARWEKWDDLRARQAAATTAEELAVLAKEQERLEEEGVKELLRQDMDRESQWFWLSFRDVDRNENLGVAIVEGGGIMEAALNAKLRKCNPGGEVLGYPLDPDRLPPPEMLNRLLTEEELVEAGLIES